jgi:hypothetical protein
LYDNNEFIKNNNNSLEEHLNYLYNFENKIYIKNNNNNNNNINFDSPLIFWKYIKKCLFNLISYNEENNFNLNNENNDNKEFEKNLYLYKQSLNIILKNKNNNLLKNFDYDKLFNEYKKEKKLSKKRLNYLKILKQKYEDYLSKDSFTSNFISLLVIKKIKKKLNYLLNNPLKFYDNYNRRKNKNTINYNILKITQELSLLNEKLIKFNLKILQLTIKENIKGITIKNNLKSIILEILTNFELNDFKSFTTPKITKNTIDLENSPTIPFILLDENEEILRERIKKYFNCKLIYKHHIKKFVNDQMEYIVNKKNLYNQKIPYFINIDKEELQLSYENFFNNYYNENNTIDDRFKLLNFYEKLKNKEEFLNSF